MITLLIALSWIVYVIIAIILVGGAVYLLDIAPVDAQIKQIGRFIIIIVAIIVALLFLLQIAGGGTVLLK